MRIELWSSLAITIWFATFVGCHAPENETESVRYTQAYEKFDSYTMANINIAYEDENGYIYSETLETGKYGEGIIGNSRGVAVHVRAQGPGGAQDHSGCTWPLLSVATPDDPLPSEPWIAVIRRGNCNFEVKVQNAWQSNASAVLVYNDRDTTFLEKMKLSTDNTRNISAIFTYKWKGEEITGLIDSGTRVYVEVIHGKTFTNINKIVMNNGFSTTKTSSTLFVSISFIVLMMKLLA